MDEKRLYYLNTLGISAWKSRTADSIVESPYPFAVATMPNNADTEQGQPLDDKTDSALATDHDFSQDLSQSNHPPPPSNSLFPACGTATATDWEHLRAEVSACTACALHKTRTQTVFGVGPSIADWMFIGEAPGADEDRQGEPFVGRAGRLLNAMIEAIGLKREEIYIANILKCRPPNNREPEPSESLSCESFLLRQIALVNPKIILAVGRIAAQNLLATTTPIGQMRGRRFVFRDTGIPVVVTYHPAYLLRSPLQKRRSWEDLLLARTVYAEKAF